eukprot:7622950-Pyramimonas_sp.AAC.1
MAHPTLSVGIGRSSHTQHNTKCRETRDNTIQRMRGVSPTTSDMYQSSSGEPQNRTVHIFQGHAYTLKPGLHTCIRRTAPAHRAGLPVFP